MVQRRCKCVIPSLRKTRLKLQTLTENGSFGVQYTVNAEISSFPAGKDFGSSLNTRRPRAEVHIATTPRTPSGPAITVCP